MAPRPMIPTAVICCQVCQHGMYRNPNCYTPLGCIYRVFAGFYWQLLLRSVLAGHKWKDPRLGAVWSYIVKRTTLYSKRSIILLWFYIFSILARTIRLQSELKTHLGRTSWEGLGTLCCTINTSLIDCMDAQIQHKFKLSNYIIEILFVFVNYNKRTLNEDRNVYFYSVNKMKVGQTRDLVLYDQYLANRLYGCPDPSSN